MTCGRTARKIKNIVKGYRGSNVRISDISAEEIRFLIDFPDSVGFGPQQHLAAQLEKLIRSRVEVDNTKEFSEDELKEMEETAVPL